ncbi:MAG: carboxypeptidase regulatory-like domain-containing protein, partial [Acidobacteriota bacterium]
MSSAPSRSLFQAPRGLPLSAGLIIAAFTALAPSAWGDISGTVVDDAMQPVAGASVHLQADPDGPSTVSAADGTFTLPLAVGGPVRLAASLAYDPDATTNYHTNVLDTSDPAVGVVIELLRVPTVDDPNYMPPTASQGCQFCHSEIFDEWSTSVHSTATLDFWVRDLFSGDGPPGGSNGFVYINTHDPTDTGTCATCHAPMADVFNPGQTFLNQVVADGIPGQIDGVNCVTCHQIERVDGDVNAIHTLGQTSYRFPDGDLPTSRHVFGPLPDVDTNFMRATYAPFFTESRICASCHQYQAPFGQTTFEEWLDSPFAVAGPDFRSCQDCHMPQRAEEGRICDVGPTVIRPPEQRHSHAFIGSTPETLSDNMDLTAEVVSQLGGLVTVRAS